MVYLLKMGIFHGYVSHYQRVCLTFPWENTPGLLLGSGAKPNRWVNGPEKVCDQPTKWSEHMGLSINVGTPSYHPFIDRIFLINHPAIGVAPWKPPSVHSLRAQHVLRWDLAPLPSHHGWKPMKHITLDTTPRNYISISCRWHTHTHPLYKIPTPVFNRSNSHFILSILLSNQPTMTVAGPRTQGISTLLRPQVQPDFGHRKEDIFRV